jgi:D-beta-D-heptose 7-phosphate kinase / D-beta-D-heptose 1-phosphate adenosyltransferase
MLDEYVFGDIERISPEAPVPILKIDRREDRCGGAANTALALAALGATVHCPTVLGEDAPADRLLNLLDRVGAVQTTPLRTADRPTILKTRFVGLARHRHAQQVLRVDSERTAPLPDALRMQLLDAVADALPHCAAVAVEDYGKGVLCPQTLGEIIDLARRAELPVLVDPHPGVNFAAYRGCDVLTPNRYEAQLASGVEIIDDEASLDRAADALLNQADARAVVITLDRQGAFLKSPDRPGLLVPTRPRSVYDVSGAGDVVMAALTLTLAAGWDLRDAVALANLAGGLEVERFGVVPVTREELTAELRSLIGLRRSKIIERTALEAELDRLRRNGARIVCTNGCFDLLHMGHVGYLQQARERGTHLVVAINSDDSVRRLKGPRRPVIDADERAAMLAALECVDYVTVFDEDTPEALLELLQPDILAKGGSTGEIVGREIVEHAGGQVVRLDLVEGRSTTSIINRILETHDG